MKFNDKLESLVAGLGTSRDKMATVAYTMPLWTDEQLATAYRVSWLAKKIVSIPVFDSFRKWRNWQADTSDISKLEALEKKLNLRGKLVEWKLKARLFGWAALYLGTDDDDPSQPLVLERMGKDSLKYITVFPRRVLAAQELNWDISSEYYGKPEYYLLSIPNSPQIQIHASRLCTTVGYDLPDAELLSAGLNFGWGDSVLLSTLESIRQADATAANIASLVFEAKVDVVKIPDLMSKLATCPPGEDYGGQLMDRFRLAATAKGINGMLILDGEEDYSQKSATFTTLPDVATLFLQIVSGAADIPVTRLLGQSPGGLNSTGEADLRNYYDRVSSIQELEIDPATNNLTELLIRSSLGARPDDVFFNWASLWQTTDKERAEIGKIDAETIRTINDTGLFPAEAVAVAAANLLTEHSIMPGLEAAIDDAGGLDLDEGTDPADEQEQPPLPRQQPDNDEDITDAAPAPLYVYRKVQNAADIIAWARAQGFATTLPADALHVTVAYSRQPLDWLGVGEPFDEVVTIGEGGPRVVERLGSAVVLSFASSSLKWRHTAMKEAGASWDYEGYTPHISITYEAGDLDLTSVEPYRGRIILGPEVFETLHEGWRPENEV